MQNMIAKAFQKIGLVFNLETLYSLNSTLEEREVEAYYRGVKDERSDAKRYATHSDNFIRRERKSTFEDQLEDKRNDKKELSERFRQLIYLTNYIIEHKDGEDREGLVSMFREFVESHSGRRQALEDYSTDTLYDLE